MVRYFFLMSPGKCLVSGCTFQPCMLNESHLITHFSVFFSPQCVFLFSHQGTTGILPQQNKPQVFMPKRRTIMFVILIVSSFSLEACGNAMRISGIKEIRNFRIILLKPHCPSNMKSCLFPEKEKASKSIYRSAIQKSFLSCFWGSLVPFFTLRVVLVCKIVY